MVTPRDGHGGAAPRWPGAGGRRCERAGDDLTSAELYDPASWDLVGHREACSGSGWLPADVAARRQGARRRRRGRRQRSPDATAPRCTTRPAGPGPPPGRGRDGGDWSCCDHGHGAAATARSSSGCGRRRQLYDPASGTWTATGKMNTPRLRPHGHPAVRRQGARGGRRRHVVGDDSVRTRPRSTTPSRDPGPRSRTCTRRARARHGDACCPMARCWWWDSRLRSEVYDPTTGTWTARAMPTESGRSQRHCCRMAPC